MYLILGLCALACTIACDSSSSSSKGPVKGAASGAGSASASGAGSASASEVCKPVNVCGSFPIARVEKLCGGGIAKVQPTNTVSDAYVLDACVYQIANGASVATIERTCIPSTGGGASTAAQLFQAGHDEKKGDRVVESNADGIGDKGYYRKQDRSMRLMILKGNRLLGVASDFTPETEAAVKQQCLLAIANELMAL